jgi:Trp operon repressor
MKDAIVSNDPRYQASNPHDDDREMEAAPVDSAPADSSPELEAWGELLEETQQATTDPQTAVILRNFVRSFPDEAELSLDRVVQLVRLILRQKFSQRKLPAECATWIAEVLYYDPTSHQRVKTLWNLARD